MGFKTRPTLPAESATAPETDHPADHGKAAAGVTEINTKTDQMNIIMTAIVRRTDTVSRGLQSTAQMLFFSVLNKRLTFCCCDIEVMPGPPATTETSVIAAPNGFIPFHAGTNLSPL